ncbi:Uncharacterised protein [Mycobacteroides abscessus subsp. abscessus]|nr:Uncharacterised protein [Mycobacteroides abscessus subsp. abscessus]
MPRGRLSRHLASRAGNNRRGSSPSTGRRSLTTKPRLPTQKGRVRPTRITKHRSRIHHSKATKASSLRRLLPRHKLPRRHSSRHRLNNRVKPNRRASPPNRLDPLMRRSRTARSPRRTPALSVTDALPTTTRARPRERSDLPSISGTRWVASCSKRLVGHLI